MHFLTTTDITWSPWKVLQQVARNSDFALTYFGFLTKHKWSPAASALLVALEL